ncbi:Ras-related protein Rab [Acrasis kona]|uniref:Ras-related protein Rab n=1 Tax=Acrasis kona TaxID=1008807 RepID=A0AAW2ZKV5_9EUKA
MYDTNDYHLLFKMIMVGDSGVGKSCLVTRFKEDRFDPRVESTIGVEFVSKTVDLDQYKVRVALWDTAGQEKFHSIARSYYRGSACVALVYDVTRISTFESISRWLRDAKTNRPSHCNNVIYILIGNKIDIKQNRQVSYEQGVRFATENDIALYAETSAVEGVFVQEAFKECANLILDKVLQKQIGIAGFEDDMCNSGVKAGKLAAKMLMHAEGPPSPNSPGKVTLIKDKNLKVEKDSCCSSRS